MGNDQFDIYMRDPGTCLIIVGLDEFRYSGVARDGKMTTSKAPSTALRTGPGMMN
jgi:hypothetical protein